MKKTWFRSGQWDVICDVCGFAFKNTELKLRWDGLMVCDSDWESRHPQEMIRPIPDQNKLPWTRPDPPDVEIGPTYSGVGVFCTPTGLLSQADYGTADCMTVGNVNGGLIV